jgi:hypothetical protein
MRTLLLALAVGATVAHAQAPDPYLARAHAVLKAVPLIDGHNDLPWAIRTDTIARGDVLWNDDVSLSMLWLGEVFVEALAPWLRATVYRDEFVGGTDGRAVCFASTSPGEVFAGASKVVGISQRRTREGARFQCVLYRQWSPLDWADCLSSTDLAQRVHALDVAQIDVAPQQVMDALLTTLARIHS